MSKILTLPFIGSPLFFFANKRIENTIWNKYFLKQHFGVRTILLDWTENALFALFFAINDDKLLNENGKVWLLAPSKLNNYSTSKLLPRDKSFYSILTASGKIEEQGDLENENGELRVSELLRKYYRLDCKKEEKLYPLAIYPPLLDERMSAQQACFTLFGNVVKGLENNDTKEQFGDCVYIKAGSKQNILNELKILGVSDYSLYPDLDGLGKAINYQLSRDISQVQEENDFQVLWEMQAEKEE